jgi:hypothetical protein
MKIAVFWLIAQTTEGVSSSETSIKIYRTIRLNIPEDNNLRTRGRENLSFQQEEVS